MPLNSEERQELVEMLAHEGVKGLYKALDDLAQDKELKVLQFRLGEEKELLILKCRAEGARDLAEALKRQLNSLKPKS